VEKTSKKELFEFLKENLTLDYAEAYDSGYGPARFGGDVTLLLRNPETGEWESIASISL